MSLRGAVTAEKRATQGPQMLVQVRLGDGCSMAGSGCIKSICGFKVKTEIKGSDKLCFQKRETRAWRVSEQTERVKEGPGEDEVEKGGP